MSGLNFYLVSYDISDDERLRNVRKAVEGFGRRMHYSVYRCDLNRKGRVELKAELSDLINHEEDRIMIINLGPLDGKNEDRITFLGKHDQDYDRDAVIV